jgi:hypothetical protein
MSHYAEQLCQSGPVLRRQGCGRAMLAPAYFTEPGPVPTFDVQSGRMIGMNLQSDAPMGPCRRDGGSEYSMIAYGQTIDESCPGIEACVLCNAHPAMPYPPCLDAIPSVPNVAINSPTNGATLSTRTASIVFSVASVPSALGTTCQLDSASAVAFTSPHTYSGLVDGPHTVKVIATNSSGSSRPATVSFAVMTGASAQVK